MKGMNRHLLVLLALLFVVVAAFKGCAGQATGVNSAEKQVLWDHMDYSQRRAHMQSVVVPLAAEVFGDWRPERFGDVDCSLCHGPEYLAEIYAMPTAHLPGLSGKLLLGPEFKNHPDTTRLKLDRLVPGMAAALNQNTFSLVTRRGFGCYSCHLGPSGPKFGN